MQHAVSGGKRNPKNISRKIVGEHFNSKMNFYFM
jgi:hypothetical protein